LGRASRIFFIVDVACEGDCAHGEVCKESQGVLFDHILQIYQQMFLLLSFENDVDFILLRNFYKVVGPHYLEGSVDVEDAISTFGATFVLENCD
jgi:hypothetical protein